MGFRHYSQQKTISNVWYGSNVNKTISDFIARDQYFNYVTMLLHGDGTNATQNNTFIDSSSNNFTLSRVGNTTQGTFTPFGDNWSNYFDGSGDNLTIGPTSAFSIATSTTPFTIECWVYPTADGGCIFNEQYTGAGNPVDISINMSSGTVGTTNGRIISFGYYTGSAWVTGAIANSQLTLNSWTHIACVFTGSTTKIFYNGVDVTLSSPTPATTWGRTGSSGNNWYIGQRWDTAGIPYFSGYISNFRFVNGTAIYTSNFTPSTSPLTAISGTSLLTCQSNRIRDNSTNNLTITLVGNTSVQKFSPFSPTSSYSSTSTGGSISFDGTGDYLTLPSNSAFAMGTGDFTFETWIYPRYSFGGSTYQTIAGNRSGAVNSATEWTLGVTNGGVVYVYTNGFNISTAAGTLTNDQWYHLALVRSSGTATLYINGGSVATANMSGYNFTDTTFTIAANDNGSEPLSAILSNCRLLKGTALYTTTFTPPTSPLTNITNTSLLLNGINAGIFDNAMMNNLETVGNAQISTTQSKFGGSSMYFDGTGDYLVTRATPQLTFGGDFTVEAWVYITSAASYHSILEGRTAATYSNYVFGIYNVSGTLRLDFVNAGGATGRTATTTSVPLNTWTHVAWVRSSGTTSYFVNGVKDATTNSYSAALSPASSIVLIGAIIDPAYFNGYIDDLRVTNGFARYTTNFTPPTAPFEDL